MNKKVLAWLGVGFVLYILFALSVLLFYKDNPADMDWEDREAYNRRHISQLNLDDLPDKKAILDMLGTPDIVESRQQGTVHYDLLYYRTQHVKSDGKTTKDECTPLLFENGQLILWGQQAADRFAEL